MYVEHISRGTPRQLWFIQDTSKWFNSYKFISRKLHFHEEITVGLKSTWQWKGGRGSPCPSCSPPIALLSSGKCQNGINSEDNGETGGNVKNIMSTFPKINGKEITFPPIFDRISSCLSGNVDNNVLRKLFYCCLCMFIM